MSEIIFLDAQDLRYEFSWDKSKAASNLSKHGVAFRGATEVFCDSFALTRFDMAHSVNEERWLTLGHDQSGRVLVVCHTIVAADANTMRVRIISARPATREERKSFIEHCQMHAPWRVQQPRSVYGAKMNSVLPATTVDDDDTPPEFDFVGAEMGKFYHPNAKFSMPLYLEPDVMAVLLDIGKRKKLSLDTLTDDMVKYGLAQLAAEHGVGGARVV